MNPELARRAPEPLSAFNAAGVLTAADVHVAQTLLTLGGVAGPDTPGLALAAALAVRAPRLGHVYVDLASVATTIANELPGAPERADEEPVRSAEDLVWPDPESWPALLARHPELVAVGEADGELRPLRLLDSRLYLERYWREERVLAARLLTLDAQPARSLELPLLAELLTALLPGDESAAQRWAAASAALRGLTVIAGGPGTGKTTTVARSVALLAELAARQGAAPPLIGLCAPTGKAAARLAEAIGAETETLPVSERARTSVRELAAGTIHRLLGARGPGRFRHDANNPLPHDIVIVDETSMVSLSLVCRLLDAVRSDARLVLVGDPDQLSAIEAGAVLADIVGPAAEGPAFGPGMRAILTKAGGADPGPSTVESEFGSGVVVLRHGHRFGAPIGQLADAIRRGDTDAAVSAAASDVPEIDWIRTDPAALSRGDGGDLRASVLAGFGEMLAAAREGAGAEALAALGTLRLLCAHRHGPYGVSSWTASVEDWLTQELGVSVEGDYPGRPLLITENDHELRLYNGDAGVIVSGPDGPTAVFEREGGQLSLAPARLAAVETAFASTIHKSQGSQFSTAAVILPGQDSRLLTRELLYTAVTRARKRVLLVGEEAALRAAVERPVQRATGLQNRLWG